MATSRSPVLPPGRTSSNHDGADGCPPRRTDRATVCEPCAWRCSHPPHDARRPASSRPRRNWCSASPQATAASRWRLCTTPMAPESSVSGSCCSATRDSPRTSCRRRSYDSGARPHATTLALVGADVRVHAGPSSGSRPLAAATRTTAVGARGHGPRGCRRLGRVRAPPAPPRRSRRARRSPAHREVQL